MSAPSETETGHARPRLGGVVPAAIFSILAGAVAVGLSLDPEEIPSALIGRPVPEFDLAPVQGRAAGLATADLQGEVSLVNVFASWCAECRREHPFLMELSRSGRVPLHGLNYKDKPADARGWLDGLGDAYIRTGADIDGRVAIDFGAYGVPETFLVGKDGRIAYRHIGAMTPEIFARDILPRIRDLQAAR